MRGGEGCDNERLLEKFDGLDNVRSGDNKLVKHKKILPELMVWKFTKIHCYKEAMVTSSNCDFAWCPKCFNEYQKIGMVGGQRAGV